MYVYIMVYIYTLCIYVYCIYVEISTRNRMLSTFCNQEPDAIYSVHHEHDAASKTSCSKYTLGAAVFICVENA